MSDSRGSISDREERLGEVVFGCLQAVENGQPLDREEVIARHPEFAAELAEFFADRDRVDRVARPPRETDSPAPNGETVSFTPVSGSGDAPLPAGTRVGYF